MVCCTKKIGVCQDIGSLIFQFAFFVERLLIKTKREELANLECRSFVKDVDLPKFYGQPQDALAVKPQQTGVNGWERCVSQSQAQKLSQKFDSIWVLYSQPHVAEMILQGGNTNKNDLLHLSQFGLARKDIN